MIIKLDLTKAYDSMSWQFIKDTLVKVRIPENLVGIITTIIMMGSTSILWAGEQLEPFQSSKGVKQGDLLSPYVFLLCIECLSQLIEPKVQRGEWIPMVPT